MDFRTIIATIILETGRFLFGWWNDIRKKKLELRDAENLEKILQVSECLDHIRRKTQAVRVVMVRCNNNGKEIKPGVTWYGTITDETTKDNWEPAKPYFNRLELDDDYKRRVVMLMKLGSVLIKKNELKEGTLICDVFNHDGIKSGYAHKIKYGPKKQHFLICQYDTPEPSARSIHIAKTQAAKIIRLME